MSLRTCGYYFRQRIECCSHGVHRGLNFATEPVPFGEGSGIVVGEPCGARSVLPDQSLQRQIDADRLNRLHERRAALGITEDQEAITRRRGGTFTRKNGS